MKLTIEDARKLGAAAPVLEMMALIERYGGEWVGRSKHSKTAQLWIADFPLFRDLQIGVPLNTQKLSLYMRGGIDAGDAFEQAVLSTGALIPPPKKGGRHTALNDWKGLSPDNGRVILVDARAADTEQLLKIYLARSGALLAASPQQNEDVNAPPVTRTGLNRHVTPESLRRSLDRNSETGRAGERFAYLDEMARLASLGCPDPAAHVHIEADTNVAAGYDLKSDWKGEVRYIEVKTATSAERDFFLTANECDVLARLGAKSWIYRVRLVADGAAEVVWRLQDPMASISGELMEPVVWRVPELVGTKGDGGS